MKVLLKYLSIPLLVLMLGAVAGCDNNDDLSDKIDDIGDEIEDTVDDAADDVEDAVDDAKDKM